MNLDRVLAVIPARGGSKGIPRKNARRLGDRPLVAHSIRAALESPGVSRVVVSTEDEEIAEISRAWGAEVPFRRPDALAGDHAPLTDVLWHAVSRLETDGWRPDAVVMLLPTHPFRPEGIVEEAVARIRTTCIRVGTVVPVPDADRFWAEADGLRRSLGPGSPGGLPVYRSHGCLFATEVLPDCFRDGGNPSEASAYVRSRIRAGDRRWEVYASNIPLEDPRHWADLDYEDDWTAAEILWRSLFPSEAEAVR